MRRLFFLTFIFCLISSPLTAGDYAIGDVEYRVDLGQKFSVYEMTPSDQAWGTRLAKRFKYHDKVAYFVRTSINMQANGEWMTGAVYQALDKRDYFYVAPGDAMLRVGAMRPLSPGVGGFSMHTPASKDFIACFNCFTGGVPFVFGTSITLGPVKWYGDRSRRF